MAAEPPVSPENTLAPSAAAAADGGEKSKVAEDKVSPVAGTTPPQEAPRVEVSAATITRMMGIASTNDLRLLEGRIDVLTSKVAGLVSKVERVLSMFSGLPSSSDLDRLEIQVSTVKSIVREIAENMESAKASSGATEKQLAAEQSKKIRDGIKSNQE